MHVRISDRGWDILDNRELAQKVAKAIMDDKSNFEVGKAIQVTGEGVSVQLVTSIKEEKTEDQSKSE